MISFVTTLLTIPLASAAIAVVYLLQYRTARRWRTPLVAIHFLAVSGIITTYAYLCFTHYNGGVSQIAGWIAFALGSAFFWYSAFIHKASLVPRDGYGVMASGPYGYIRHPIYAGGLLAALGLLAVSPSRELAVAWVVLAVSLWALTEIEERELRERLGSDYESYCRRTKRLVPGLI